jgi:hypothetical protein
MLNTPLEESTTPPTKKIIKYNIQTWNEDEDKLL